MPATLTYRVSVRGIGDVLAKLTPHLYLPAVQELLSSASVLGERVARQRAPRDTGALARSLTHEVRPLSARVYSHLGYAAAVETGRAAGARMPPPAALEGWMRRHGLRGSPFALARAIGRRGLRGRFFLRAAATAVGRQMPFLAGQAARTIEARWGKK